MTPVDPVKAFDALTQGLANGFVIAAAVGYVARRLRGPRPPSRSGGGAVPPPPPPPAGGYAYVGWTEGRDGVVSFHYWRPGR